MTGQLFTIDYFHWLWLKNSLAVNVCLSLSSPLPLSQLEEQVSRLQREKNDLQSRMEEDQEDMNELMKKHKSAVVQVTDTMQGSFWSFCII